MTVGIASLWYEHPELLPEFIRLMSVGGWDQLVIVDNASGNDARQAYVEAAQTLQDMTGGSACVLHMEHNSVLHGWNAGMAALDTDVVIQMANDVVMTDPRWLAWGIEGLAPGTMQGPICWLRGNVLYVDGCCTVATREDWQCLGGLDAEYFLHPGYWSDVDLAWRAWMQRIQVRPTRCGIRHLGGYTSGGGNAPGFWEHEQENCRRFMRRYAQSLLQHYAVTLPEGALHG